MYRASPAPPGQRYAARRVIGPVAEAAVIGQRPQVRCGHRGHHNVASPARTSSHSALSFHTSICTMRPCRTT